MYVMQRSCMEYKLCDAEHSRAREPGYSSCSYLQICKIKSEHQLLKIYLQTNFYLVFIQNFKPSYNSNNLIKHYLGFYNQSESMLI